MEKRQRARASRYLAGAHIAPEVSFVIATRLQALPRLEAACASIDGGAELIVVIDGAQELSQLVRDMATVIEIEEHRGIAAALNEGIRASHGAFVCWLGSDDIRAPGTIQRQRQDMETIGAPASFGPYIEEGGAVLLCDRPTAAMFQDNVICGSTIMVRRQVLDHVGLFDETLRWCEDWDMFCRIQDKYGWKRLGYPMATCAVNPEGHTFGVQNDPARKAARDKDYAAVHKRWVHKRR